MTVVFPVSITMRGTSQVTDQVLPQSLEQEFNPGMNTVEGEHLLPKQSPDHHAQAIPCVSCHASLHAQMNKCVASTKDSVHMSGMNCFIGCQHIKVYEES